MAGISFVRACICLVLLFALVSSAKKDKHSKHDKSSDKKNKKHNNDHSKEDKGKQDEGGEYSCYNLKSDPSESVDVYSDDDYDTQVNYLKKRAGHWKLRCADADYPSDTTNEDAAYDACGGICSWLEDSDDWSKPKIEQKYSFDNAPHIVFIVVDDWGYNDLGKRSTYMPWTTPSIDRLVDEGILIENHFTHQSCVPSRGALLTGRYSLRLGLTYSDDPELPITETTLAEELKSAGYRCYHVGKWQMGYSTPSKTPVNRGFDGSYAFWTHHIDYYTKQGCRSGDVDAETWLDLHDNDQLVTDAYALSSTTHSVYLFQQKVESFIEEHRQSGNGAPMFLLYESQLMHYPLDEAPDIYKARCSPDVIPDDTNAYARNYCAMNVMLDEIVYNTTCKLAKEGMLDNTLLVIISDNGGDGTYVSGNSFPYRGYSKELFRGGLSTTAIVHGALIPESSRGSIYSGQFHITDWLPTLMGLATDNQWTGSYSGKELDGVDQWEAIIHGDESPRSEIVHYVQGDNDYYSIQIDMLKLNYVPSIPEVGVPEYVYDADNNPDLSRESCSAKNYLDSLAPTPAPTSLL